MTEIKPLDNNELLKLGSRHDVREHGDDVRRAGAEVLQLGSDQPTAEIEKEILAELDEQSVRRTAGGCDVDYEDSPGHRCDQRCSEADFEVTAKPTEVSVELDEYDAELSVVTISWRWSAEA